MYPMYNLLVYERELSKNDYLKILQMTIIIIKTNNSNNKIIIIIIIKIIIYFHNICFLKSFS